MTFSSVFRNGTLSLMALAALSACATPRNNPTASNDLRATQDQAQAKAETYNESELVAAISTHLGVTSESAATAIERLFKERGQPVGYITGEEGGGALTIGARFGNAGADASKVFTLVYGLNDIDDIYRRFPGVDGSAYLVGGMAVNYQRTNDITLAPVRTGVGLRLGANVGYTRYTRERALPF